MGAKSAQNRGFPTGRVTKARQVEHLFNLAAGSGEEKCKQGKSYFKSAATHTFTALSVSISCISKNMHRCRLAQIDLMSLIQPPLHKGTIDQ
jgi:hypothetical protein